MLRCFPRLLLSLSALLLAAGGAMHAAVFGKTQAAVAASDLPAFFGNSLKLLWLADSAGMFVLAAVLGFIALRPHSATRPVVMLLALLPASTAALLYAFLGSFFAGHLLLATAVATFLAGLLSAENPRRETNLPSSALAAAK